MVVKQSLENTMVRKRGRIMEETLDILAKRCTRYQECLGDIYILARRILRSNEPPCFDDEECPVNGGVGFDNHCDLTCPFILAKKIIDKIREVEQ